VLEVVKLMRYVIIEREAELGSVLMSLCCVVLEVVKLMQYVIIEREAELGSVLVSLCCVEGCEADAVCNH